MNRAEGASSTQHEDPRHALEKQLVLVLVNIFLDLEISQTMHTILVLLFLCYELFNFSVNLDGSRVL